MYQEVILGFFGIASQLVVRIPVVDNWYNQEKFNNWRGLMMAGFALGLTGVIFGVSCTPLFAVVPCTEGTAWQLARDFLVLFGTNQLVYLATPSTKALTARKAK